MHELLPIIIGLSVANGIISLLGMTYMVSRILQN
jgi:hypothetical protein